MLKWIEGLGRRPASATVLFGAALLVGQAGFASEEPRHAVSADGDAGVTRGWTDQVAQPPVPGSPFAAPAARAESDGGGRTAVPRGSGGSGSGSGARSGGSGSRSGGSGSSGGSWSHSGGGSGGARTAVPRSGAEGTRRPSGGHGGGGHHNGGGHHHGGTVVVGSGWWYDPWWYGPAWGWWGWYGPWAWGPYGGYGGYYGGYGGAGYRGGGGEAYGALDLDLWPDDVEVFVDGQRVGEVDEFDGFPTYLWLPTGTYDVVFYRDGFVTLPRQYSIYAGQVIDVNDRLEKGESIRPEDLPSTSTANREARLQRNREREDYARSGEAWREREGWAAEDDEDDEEAMEAEDAEEGKRPAEGATMARLRFSITPDDASLYLDGNFLGTAREISQLSAGLVVAAGAHRLEVVRPGYEPEEISFHGEPGEEIDLNVELDRN